MALNLIRELSKKPDNQTVMPAFFMGHGSPMNGIENNIFSNEWKSTAKDIPIPRAILCISAHWLTHGTLVTAMENPKTIHDFGGFPESLYQVQYPAPGNPLLAAEIAGLASSTHAGLDHEWGLDHGAWTVIRHMYPNADIPVLQLSIDYHQPGAFHYKLASELADLRRKGVLIIGSGNMVHNLRMVAFDKLDQPGYGYDWAIEMNEVFKKQIASGDHQPLLNYNKLGPSARLAVPTPDHYWPLLYVLGMRRENEEAVFFNDAVVGGSITMTSVRFG